VVCTIRCRFSRRSDECRSVAAAAIGAVPYASAVKVGLQFKRRFWEEDDTSTVASATPISRSPTSVTPISAITVVARCTAGRYIWAATRWNSPQWLAGPCDESREYGVRFTPIPQGIRKRRSHAWHRSPFTMDASECGPRIRVPNITMTCVGLTDALRLPVSTHPS